MTPYLNLFKGYYIPTNPPGYIALSDILRFFLCQLTIAI